jgi:hypothetical protein
MDIIAFEKQRESDLKQFESTYAELRDKYMRTLAEAVNELDPQKQGDLINTVLEINTNLSAELRAFIAGHETYNSDDVKKLTDDLVRYQEEHTKIKQSEDMKKTLEMILNEDQNKLNDMKFQFNIYIGLLVLGIVTILFYIFWLSIPSLPTMLSPALQ